MKKRTQAPRSIFMSNIGWNCLSMGRKVERLKEIQKKNPEFNYRDNWHLKQNIDLMMKFLNELKTIGVKDEK